MVKLASRLKEPYKTEKCPVCMEIGGAAPFFELELGRVPVLVCARASCRCLFVPSYVDLKRLVIESKPEIQGVQEGASDLACKVCGKECKSALGLSSHMRSHV